MNCFDFFGIPFGYNVDASALTKIYLRRQARVHPDANASNCKESAELNAAYKTLMNPIERARHFLEILGRRGDDLDPQFAAEAFELREKYESLIASEDKKKFQDKLSQRIAELIATLHNLEDNLDEFQKYCGLLRFIDSFLEKIKSDVYSRD
jgi:molecular chaperone HscB